MSKVDAYPGENKEPVPGYGGDLLDSDSEGSTDFKTLVAEGK